MDEKYMPRDCFMNTQQEADVVTVANILSSRPSKVTSTTRLAALLAQKPVIGGYGRRFDKVQITDILETDLGVEWGSLVQKALDCSEPAKYRSIFLFSLLAFSPLADMELLTSIISFALIPKLKELALPDADSYCDFVPAQICEVDTIGLLMGGAKRPYIPPDNLQIGQLAIQRLKHEAEAASACKSLAKSLVAQWPSRDFDQDQLAAVEPMFLDREEALFRIRPEWIRLVDNFRFSQHLDQVQLVLSQYAIECAPSGLPVVVSDTHPPELDPIRNRGSDCPTLQKLLERDIPMPPTLLTKRMPPILGNLPNGRPSMPLTPSSNGDEPKNVPISVHVGELRKLVAPYQRSPSMIHQRYGAELQQSIKALGKYLATPTQPQESLNKTKLRTELFNAKENISRMLQDIQGALQQGDKRSKWLFPVGLWPKMTIRTLLTELRTTSGTKFGNGVKETLVNLALAVTTYQRLLRLLDAFLKRRRQQMADELDNIGHTNWSPMEHVDWLLLEVDSNVMLRSDQINVALATISPKSGRNSVVQLLMGKGKTSCILRMSSIRNFLNLIDLFHSNSSTHPC
jgi:hypothetical protein